MRAVVTWPRWLLRHPTAWFVVVAIAIPLGFVVDGFCNSDTQWILAGLAWWTLIGAMSGCSRRERVQVLLLVALATAAEITFSLVLGWYTYRLDNIPPWIPPAHGIVFLTAVLWSKQAFAIRRQDTIQLGVTIAAVGYGLTTLLVANDVGGAVGVGMLMVWLWAFGNERTRFYSMMWLVVCYLEACGVIIGAWTWAPHVPLLGWPEANPPSGIVGVYGFFDLVALGLAAVLLDRAPKLPLRNGASQSRERALG